MPTYSYECAQCGHVFDLFHGISAEPQVKCETCDAECHRLIGAGAGIIFKGSGFYETDYKNKSGSNGNGNNNDKSGKESAKSESGSAASDTGNGNGKSETKAGGAAKSDKAAKSSTAEKISK